MMLALLRRVSLVVFCATPAASYAVTFWGSKATDASVCDLAPATSSRVSQKVLIPADTDVREAAEAYFRVAASFVATNCRNGQLLILQGRQDLPFDGIYLQNLANMACLAATVQRSSIAASSSTRDSSGFELRCVISKHSSLAADLQERERVESSPVLFRRIQKRAVGSSDSSEESRNSDTGSRDCGRFTLGSLVLGGSNSGCR